MNDSNIDVLVKMADPELVEDFKSELCEGEEWLLVQIELDKLPEHWMDLRCMKAGDIPFDFHIKGKSKYLSEKFGIHDIYAGKILIRDRSVLYYDKNPVGGGPFKIEHLGSPELRRRAVLISNNINQLLGSNKKYDIE